MNKISNLKLLTFSFILLLSLTGCDSNSEASNEINEINEISDTNSIVGMYFCESKRNRLKLKTIDLRDNGKAYYKTMVLGAVSENFGTYVIDLDKLIINNDGQSLLFTIDEKKLTINQAGLQSVCQKELNDEEKKFISKKSKIIGYWKNAHGKINKSYNFNIDGSFYYKENNQETKGKWILNNEHTLIIMPNGAQPKEPIDFSFITKDYSKLGFNKGRYVTVFIRTKSTPVFPSKEIYLVNKISRTQPMLTMTKVEQKENKTVIDFIWETKNVAKYNIGLYDFFDERALYITDIKRTKKYRLKEVEGLIDRAWVPRGQQKSFRLTFAKIPMKAFHLVDGGSKFGTKGGWHFENVELK